MTHITPDDAKDRLYRHNIITKYMAKTWKRIDH